MPPFRLKTTTPSLVGEISRMTAESGVPAEKRVDFHIGNPVWDPRLNRLYNAILSGANFFDPEAADFSEEDFLGELDDPAQRAAFRLIFEASEKSVAYAPQGGFSPRNPGTLTRQLKAHFLQEEIPVLPYDFGESTGRPEFALASGGRPRVLALLLQLIQEEIEGKATQSACLGDSTFLLHSRPAFAYTLRRETFHTETLPADIGFLFLFDIFPETERKQLVQWILEHDLFLIEANQSHNAESLAALPGMKKRTLRVLAPDFLHPELRFSSLCFLLGPVEWISRFNRFHFKKMGTPSASEIKLLSFFLTESGTFHWERWGLFQKKSDPATSFVASLEPADEQFPGLVVAQKIARNLETRTARISETAANLAQKIGRRTEETVQTLTTRLSRFGRFDPFGGKSQQEVAALFFSHLNDPLFAQELQESFLSVFHALHPDYDAGSLVLVSGSARMALSLIADAWGIEEVVVPDFSWTVGDAFPRVTSVPLKDDFSLDVTRFVRVLQNKLETDPAWPARGAVILNNPHNATGHIWPKETVAAILQFCLQAGIRVIDDLSYADVLPVPPEQRAQKVPFPNLKKIAWELMDAGRLRRSQLRFLVTIQSISKTDCKAGARLAVCEILDAGDRAVFLRRLANGRSNQLAILLATLFYRRGPWQVQRFWALRDAVMWQRSAAIQAAFQKIPPENNPYGLRYHPPVGAMYPRLEVTRLPSGLSAERLAIHLARQGVGLIPLTNFSHTIEGFTRANRAFRLTLGGSLPLDQIPHKIRRLVETVSEQIRRQAEQYTFHRLENPALHEQAFLNREKHVREMAQEQAAHWLELLQKNAARDFSRFLPAWANKEQGTEELLREFLNDFLPARGEFFRTKLSDFALAKAEILEQARGKSAWEILRAFQNELNPPEPNLRLSRYTRRLFDRTVHPTQMYALEVEQLFLRQARHMVLPDFFQPVAIPQMLRSLVHEFVGENVPISSEKEAEEAVCDLEAFQLMETVRALLFHQHEETVISLWGDWDGSTRPSGQGHTLISGPLIANIRALAQLITEFQNHRLLTSQEEQRLAQLGPIEKEIQKFLQTLQKITRLTSVLEKKYRKTIPLEYSASRFKRLLRKIGLLRDPLKSLWKHNDRNERRMLQFRRRRSEEIRHLFSINQTLSEIARSVAERNTSAFQTELWPVLLGFYKNYLKRFYLTPRIHQKIILDKDQFTVDTTVTNLVELNVLAAQSGYSGFVFTLQVSMANNAKAILALYRKLSEERARVLRRNPRLQLPEIKVTPLFEELEAIQKIPEFLDEIWAYAEISRKLGQPPEERFLEIIGEFFIAGSDLSQQVGQLKAYALYQDARDLLDRWMWEKNLLGKIRIKFGSGESPQRQGGTYHQTAGQPVFAEDVEPRDARLSFDPVRLFIFQQARSPLSGILSHSDFRTFQSNVMERLRSLPAEELAHVLYHIQTKQHDFWQRILPLAQTFTQKDEEAWQKIRPIIRREDAPVFLEFLEWTHKNFVQIVYGRPEDMTGIHVVSYFLSRTLYPLRDRPTVRPSREPVLNRTREIVERLSSTLPLATHGTLLRAIGHNKAQTFLLGVNQFTTGLFRALAQFLEKQGDAGLTTFREHILPHLPVYDILNTLRMFHDVELKYVRAVEEAFPSGNSALQALKEENGVLNEFIPLFQEELLRKSGLDVRGRVPSRKELNYLLPFLRPDLAVLLQENIFNTELDRAVPPGRLSTNRLVEFQEEFRKRDAICAHRKKMWEMLQDPITEQVKSFIELARAVQSLFTRREILELPGSTVSRGRIERLGAQINEMLRNVVDDSMRQFLLTAVQYLLYLPENMKDVPEEVLLALRDMEKILRLEEQALSRDDQKRLMALFLKMARLSGNCG